MSTTKDKHSELYTFLGHYTKICNELSYYKSKCMELEKEKFDKLKKENNSIHVRKRVTKVVKQWAIDTRSKELGLKGITTWRQLAFQDPCVSNEYEFYKSYLEEFNNRLLKK